MGKIKLISNIEIKASLENISRQYLVGNLSKEQKLSFFQDGRLEIGISKYDKSIYEIPHYHPVATEYQYLLSGYTEYMDVETKEVYSFKKGDFYKICPNTFYAQKVMENTEILFIKVPSNNDKTTIPFDNVVKEWLEKTIVSKRVDYYYDDSSPSVNSVVPAAACAVIDNNNKLLLIKRKDNNFWTMPGGTLEFDESIEECAIREIKEETNIDVVIKGIINIYSDPNIKIEYLDGEVRQEFTILYYAECTNNPIVRLDNESHKYKWQDLNDLNPNEFTESQFKRIYDVSKYLKSLK